MVQEKAKKVLSYFSGQKLLATEILYALKRGDFVNLLISAGLPADYARKYEKDILAEDEVEAKETVNGGNVSNGNTA